MAAAADRAFPSGKTILITAADARYFHFVQGTIRSIRDQPQGRTACIGLLDTGCTAEQCAWLDRHVNLRRLPEWEFDFPRQDRAAGYLKSLLARPFLREYFPGFDCYVWIDADAWLQDWQAIEMFERGAARRGMAVVPELDRGASQMYGRMPAMWELLKQYYLRMLGPEVADRLWHYPNINAGVFALRSDAPHWEAWAAGIRDCLSVPAGVFTDQVALNFTVYERGLLSATEMLPAWCNWTCHFGMPAWDRSRSLYVEPYLPQHVIGILHITGQKPDFVIDGNGGNFDVPSTTGGTVTVPIKYQWRLNSWEQQPGSGASAEPAAAPVSGGLARVRLDFAFPQLAAREQSGASATADGLAELLSHEEAQLVYNCLRQFRGQQALMIGAQQGWAVAHAMVAGVQLDVLDAAISQPEVRDAVMQALTAVADRCEVTSGVQLITRAEPADLQKLAVRQQRQWSSVFLDWTAAGDAGLALLAVVLKFLIPDTLLLLYSPDFQTLAGALEYLQEQGWQTRVYQTQHRLSVAWRGQARPADCQSALSEHGRGSAGAVDC